MLSPFLLISLPHVNVSYCVTYSVIAELDKRCSVVEVEGFPDVDRGAFVSAATKHVHMVELALMLFLLFLILDGVEVALSTLLLLCGFARHDLHITTSQCAIGRPQCHIITMHPITNHDFYKDPRIRVSMV